VPGGDNARDHIVGIGHPEAIGKVVGEKWVIAGEA
jgi:hypothetical protein